MFHSVCKASFTKQTYLRLLLAVPFVVALMVGVNYWISVRSTLVRQEFSKLILAEQFDRAAGMVATPSKIEKNDSVHQLTAADGSKSEIPIGIAEFHILHEPNRPARNGIVDFLSCSEHFQICALWNDANRSHVVPIYCTTRGSIVVIDHVGVLH